MIIENAQVNLILISEQLTFLNPYREFMFNDQYLFSKTDQKISKVKHVAQCHMNVLKITLPRGLSSGILYIS